MSARSTFDWRAAKIRHSRCWRWTSVNASPNLAREEKTMLETIAIILIVLWLLGMVSGYTLGNFIYVLLVIAIVLFLVRLISGRRV
jgi:uncharacterized membrane protein YjdF